MTMPFASSVEPCTLASVEPCTLRARLLVRL
nr:MAG TPA: hypothetical protein [Caudoviricetes sp.]